jgi:hypothetical protein
MEGKPPEGMRDIEIEKSWQQDGYLYLQVIHHWKRLVLRCSFASPEAKEELFKQSPGQ